MKNQLLSIFLIVFVGLLLTSFTNSIYHTSGDNYSLFKIKRSKNADEINYDINITPTGKLDAVNPINVYWIKRTDANRIEPLTWIQKKFAYGLKFVSINETEAKFQFVSYSERDFVIRRNLYGSYQVFTNSNNKVVAVKRIFIQIDGGTFWVPNITKVELHATDVKTDKATIEIIEP